MQQSKICFNCLVIIINDKKYIKSSRDNKQKKQNKVITNNSIKN